MRHRILSGLLLAVAAVGVLAASPRAADAQAFTLGVRVDLTTASSPYGTAIADLNGDGRPDLIVVNSGAASISVFLSTGAGTFGARTDYATGSLPEGVVVADLNGDGKLDLAVDNYSSGTISVLLGNGAGGFGAKTDYAVPVGPNAITAADMNGDGVLDLVVPCVSANVVSILIAKPGGGYYPHADYATGSSPVGVATGDLNGDGVPDVAVANAGSGTVSIFLGNGSGGLGARTDLASGSGPEAVALADLNNDGKADLAVVNASSKTLSVFLGNGAGGFGARTDFTTANFPIALAIADLDGDGKPDAIVANQGSNSVSVFPGTGTGSFGVREDLATGTPYSVAVGDVNGDGRPEIIAPGYNIARLSVLFAAQNLFAQQSVQAQANYPTILAEADLNGDGLQDLIIGGQSGTISVRLGQSGGIFAAASDYALPPGGIAGVIRIADLNNDGHPDVVVWSTASTTAEICIFLNTGNGTLGARTDLATSGSSPSPPAIADLNGDGKPDLAYAADSSVYVLPGNGSGGFGARIGYSVFTPTTSNFGGLSVSAADINGDGRPDLVTANLENLSPITISMTVLLANGSGGFLPRTQYPLSPNIAGDYATSSIPNATVLLADVNNDGKFDAILNFGVSTNLGVMLGNGTGGFAAATTVSPPAGFAGIVRAGQASADGRLDLAAIGTSGVSLLLGDGSGGFGPAWTVPGTSGATDCAIGDVNADGRTDLIACAGINNTITLATNGLTSTIALASSVNPVATGGFVTLTASLPTGDALLGAPSGTVRFYEGTTLLGSSTLVNGIASLTSLSLPRGVDPLIADYLGDTHYFGRISTVLGEHVVTSVSPTLWRVADVGGDQGKQVRLSVSSSSDDAAWATSPVVRYDVYRQVVPGFAAAPAPLLDGDRRTVRPSEVQISGWDFVASFYANADTAYSIVVPTIADSNGAGFHRATFIVRANTAIPSVYYDSAPDSGYSVDNLPPAAPSPFTAAYISAATHLHWGENTEPDLWYYKVYRGSTSSFVPSAGNLIATRSDTGYVDSGSAGGYYALSAVDVNGNESAYSRLGPNGTAGVEDGPVEFALNAVTPNPSVGGRVTVAFSLPDDSSARLELLDVAGRRMTWREVGALGAGRHVLELAPDRSLAPGLYLVRLARTGATRVARVSVIK